MDYFMIAFIVFMVFIFGARILNDKAVKKLSVEKKAELVDLFSGTRIWTYGLLIAILILYFLILEFELLAPLVAVVIYFLLLIAFLLYNANVSYRKLKASEFPEEFIKSYLISASVRLIGILMFFGLLMQ